MGLGFNEPSILISLRNLAYYQMGRGFVLGSLGALVGIAGESFSERSPLFAWSLVVLLFFMAASKWLRLKAGESIALSFAKVLAPFMKKWKGRPFLMGIVLGFLPCMLIAWALTVAASTASPWSGAVVMMLLVLLTTLPLGLVVLGNQSMKRFQRPWMEPSLLTLSFLWTLLITLGADEMIPHFHFNFEILGEHYHFMFW